MRTPCFERRVHVLFVLNSMCPSLKESSLSIISRTDPKTLKKEFEFEAVKKYEVRVELKNAAKQKTNLVYYNYYCYRVANNTG